MKRYSYILMGPQGSGKGAQSKKLAEHLKYTQVSTGDLFREHMRRQSALGKKIRKGMDAGKLVSDDIVNEIIKELFMEDPAVPGFVLDGYPRTMNQVLFFEKFCPNHIVIYLNLSHNIIMERLSGRLSCPDGHVYHQTFNPPEKYMKCTIDNKKLFMRDDDTPKSIIERLHAYNSQTKPLLLYFEEKGNLITIDAELSIDDVFRTIVDALEKYDSN